MKRTTPAIAFCASLFALNAIAAPPQSLGPVNVQKNGHVDCTPPSHLAVCSAFHRQIRSNFTPREIGMLFNAATAYPEYLTNYGRVRNRYDKLSAEFAANNGLDSISVAIK